MKKAFYILIILFLLPACSGIQLDKADGNSVSPATLLEAVESGNFEKVKELLTSGVDVDARYDDGATALHRAAHFGDTELAEMLIDCGANVNSTDDEGRTPVDIALEAGYDAMPIVLHSSGGEAKKKPIMHIATAARYGSLKRIKELLATGQNVDLRDKENRTALIYAACNGHLDIAEFLIDHGAAVNYAGKEVSPLHIAAGNGCSELVELLISKGANVNLEPAPGCTALHWAAAHGEKVTAELVLMNGADVNAGYPDHKTPLDMAETEDMRSLLLSYGARSGKELQEGDK